MVIFLDEIDFKILKILDKNCRISNSKIANELNLSNRTVNSRISHMLQRKTIEYFSIEINTNILGFRHYIGRLKRNVDKNINSELFSTKFKEIPEIYRFWEQLDGSFTFSFYSKNPENLEQILEKIQNMGMDVINYNETRIHLSSDIPLSKLDWEIIAYLYYNSRVPQKEISLNLNVSDKTILRRLNRLKTMKLIQFVPVINFERISGCVSGVISIVPNINSKKLYLKLKNSKDIKYWRNTGSVSPSIVLFSYGKNLTEIFNMYTAIKNQPEVKKCGLTFIVNNWENSKIIYKEIRKKIQEFDPIKK